MSAHYIESARLDTVRAMRNLRLLTLLALAVALPANAGENKFLGSIVVSGASVTNFTTAAPFSIPPGGFITIYCDAAVRVLVDNRTVAASGANKGVPVAATTLFPTSVGRQDGSVSGSPSAVVAVIGSAASCDFWSRSGNE